MAPKTKTPAPVAETSKPTIEQLEAKVAETRQRLEQAKTSADAAEQLLADAERVYAADGNTGPALDDASRVAGRARAAVRGIKLELATVTAQAAACRIEQLRADFDAAVEKTSARHWLPIAKAVVPDLMAIDVQLAELRAKRAAIASGAGGVLAIAIADARTIAKQLADAMRAAGQTVDFDVEAELRREEAWIKPIGVSDPNNPLDSSDWPDHRPAVRAVDSPELVRRWIEDRVRLGREGKPLPPDLAPNPYQPAAAE